MIKPPGLLARTVPFVVLGLLLLAFLYGTTRPPARGAPIPLPKAPKKKDKKAAPDFWEGPWHMTWGGSKWHVMLRPSGDYVCISPGGGSVWRGAWSIDADGRLCVEERQEDSPVGSDPYRWRAAWDGEGLSGKCLEPESSAGVTITLARRPKVTP